MKKTWKFFPWILFCLILVFSLTGCPAGLRQKLTQRNFEQFLDTCFKEYASADAISLHFHLEHPKQYGIDPMKCAVFPAITGEKRSEQIAQKKEQFEKLQKFDLNHLTVEQQKMYRLLEDHLQLSLELEHYASYPSILGNNGVIHEIAILCAEYYFQEKEEIEIYHQLLQQIPDYFDQLIQHELKRQEMGLAPSKLLLEDTLSHLSSFLSYPLEENIFLVTFEERIQEADFLTEKQKTSYRKKNEQLISDTVLPAYENMYERLKQELHPSEDGATERIAQYPDGKTYYQLLLRQNVGTERTPEECEEILTTMLQQSMLETATLLKNEPDLQEDFRYVVPENTDAAVILTELEQKIATDFPKMDSISYTLKDLPDALSSTSACAFYILPPFDTTSRHLIYLNHARINTEDLYSTLAHEGFPGHLYQTNYFYQTMEHPLRIFLRNNGYDEGWGTYAQLYSYHFMQFEQVEEDTANHLRKLYKNNDIFSLSLCSLADLYVNYENYSLAQLTEWLGEYGIDATSAKNIYLYVIENPTSYLSYSIGYYELTQLLEQAKQNADFSLKQFHETILKHGSCPFYILSSFSL